MLLVITEVTVKLVPKPLKQQVIMASFDDVEKGGDAVAAVIAAGIIPAGLEMMDKPATRGGRAVREGGLRPRRRGDPAGRVRRHAGGSRRGDRAHEGGARARGRHRSSRVSQTEPERLRFWAGRKAAFPAVGRISPDYYCMDGTIPRKRLGEVLKAIAAMEKKYDLRCAERVPRRRRQPASADHVRRQRPGLGGARRGVRLRDPANCRSRSAARSPASTASASRRSTRCACSSTRPRWSRSSR